MQVKFIIGKPTFILGRGQFMQKSLCSKCKLSKSFGTTYSTTYGTEYLIIWDFQTNWILLTEFWKNFKDV